MQELGKRTSLPSKFVTDLHTKSSAPGLNGLDDKLKPAGKDLKKTSTMNQKLPKRTLTSTAQDRVLSDHEGTDSEEKEAELAEINSQQDEDFLSVSTRKKQLKPSSSGMQKMMQTNFMR